MTDTNAVTIDRSGPDTTDWRLMQRDKNLEMRKSIPYDGSRVYTTEERTHVSYRKSSRFNLSVSRVLELYHDVTEREVDTCKMCEEWPVGAQEREGAWRDATFCSMDCQIRYEHLQADARDAERSECR